jgi:hypothetical protein
MDGLQVAVVISLIVTVLALPMGLLRMVAITSGGFERSRTMRTSAYFALAVGLAGLVCLVGCLAALAAR